MSCKLEVIYLTWFHLLDIFLKCAIYDLVVKMKKKSVENGKMPSASFPSVFFPTFKIILKKGGKGRGPSSTIKCSDVAVGLDDLYSSLPTELFYVTV